MSKKSPENGGCIFVYRRFGWSHFCRFIPGKSIHRHKFVGFDRISNFQGLEGGEGEER